MLVKTVAICAPYILVIFVLVDTLDPRQETTIHVVAQPLALEGEAVMRQKTTTGEGLRVVSA